MRLREVDVADETVATASRSRTTLFPAAVGSKLAPSISSVLALMARLAELAVMDGGEMTVATVFPSKFHFLRRFREVSLLPLSLSLSLSLTKP